MQSFDYIQKCQNAKMPRMPRDLARVQDLACGPPYCPLHKKIKGARAPGALTLTLNNAT